MSSYAFEGILRGWDTFSRTDLIIAFYVLVAIIAVLAGIIFGLAIRAGSFRELFRITALVANQRRNAAADKRNKTGGIPNEKENIK